MDWKKLISYLTGSVDESLILQNEYLLAENRILKARLRSRPRLSQAERQSLATLGMQLGRKALTQVATLAQPETILRWHRQLVAAKWDGSKSRRRPGRPGVGEEVERLVLDLARENGGWGYDRIAGALRNLGHSVTGQTVGNILRRHGLEPAPRRRRGTTWKEFLRTHRSLMAAADFFTAEVYTPVGLVTYQVLFLIQLATRRVEIAGITRYAHPGWLTQVARNVTMDEVGFLHGTRYLLRDRDPRYEDSGLDAVLAAAGVKVLKLPARSPNLNAEAERFVRSVREECLGRVILLGERSLRRALWEYVEHYNHERNHQGRGNAILAPRAEDRVGARDGPIRRRERLGGLLNFYWREAG